MNLMEKLTILSDAAKYDVACTSSGVDRRGKSDGMGNSIAAGICHSFSADGDPVLDIKVDGEQFSDDQVANFRQYYKSFLAIAIQDYYTFYHIHV